MENQYYGLGERTIKKFPLQHDFFSKIGTQGGLSGLLEKTVATGAEFVKTGEYKFPSVDKGWRRLLEAFADAIINDKPSLIDAVSGMRVTYLSLRAMDSMRQGISLPVNIEDWEMYVH